MFVVYYRVLSNIKYNYIFGHLSYQVSLGPLSFRTGASRGSFLFSVWVGGENMRRNIGFYVICLYFLHYEDHFTFIVLLYRTFKDAQLVIAKGYDSWYMHVFLFGLVAFVGSVHPTYWVSLITKICHL